MCTLTFAALAKDQFCLTSNRDESILRESAIAPSRVLWRDAHDLLMPIDQTGRGTWLAVHLQQRRIQVLLNGAFQAHTHQPPYRKSRGLVLLDAFDFPNLQAFANAYNAQAIEPFTLVAFHLAPLQIEEVKWDGATFHHQLIRNTHSYLWSAAMLYPSAVHTRSATQFAALPHPIDPAAILAFHSTEVYPQKMERHGLLPHPRLATVSTSQLMANTDGITYRYLDYQHNHETMKQALWHK